MVWIIIKLVLTAAIVVAVSEVSRRSTTLGALLASVPLMSVLAMVWLYLDTGDAQLIARLADDILWLVLPSLLLFIALPLLLRAGRGFWPSLGVSLALTAAGYAVMLWALRHWPTLSRGG